MSPHPTDSRLALGLVFFPFALSTTVDCLRYRENPDCVPAAEIPIAPPRRDLDFRAWGSAFLLVNATFPLDK